MFFYFIGIQNRHENVFHGFGYFVIGLWKSFGNSAEGDCTSA